MFLCSLLLVDVMQQLGQDFELLLASHRTVYMDLDSGNMMDSGATSPILNQEVFIHTDSIGKYRK